MCHGSSSLLWTKPSSVELPNSDLYPKLTKTISSYMIHCPFGPARVNSPCMKEGWYSKVYPNKLTSSTTIDEEGYPCYRSHDDGRFVVKNGIKLDNTSVVPLLIRYQGHVNTEYCNKTYSIKYLCKYVNKGPDRAIGKITNASA